MESLNHTIESIAGSHYVDYIGFADLRTYQDDLTEFGGNIVKGYPNGISLGIVIPDAIVDHLLHV